MLLNLSWKIQHSIGRINGANYDIFYVNIKKDINISLYDKLKNEKVIR